MSQIEWHQLVEPRNLWALVAGLWVVTSAIVRLVKMRYRHVERLAMIDRGMKPDDEV